jgi:ribosomal protein L13
MPHFKAALKVAQREDAVRILIDAQSTILARLAGELSEYLRKHDYRFSHEPYGPEADAVVRATEILVGKKPHIAGHG